MIPTLTTFIQHCTGSPAKNKKKGKKGIQIDKQVVKDLLLADDMILCTIYRKP